MSVVERYRVINKRIAEACEKSHRSPQEVKVIAVTKYVSVDTTREAIDAGIEHIGENRLAGLSKKQQYIDETDIKWHFIGTLQSRKVKDVIHHIDYLHSLDRLSLAKEIEKRSKDTVKCFLQINVSGENSKHGLLKEEALPMIQKLQQFNKIKIVGLMTMAPYIDDEERLRHIFQELKQLQINIQAMNLSNAPCEELSMGMSNDYHIAIEEGATFIRIGTALVGNEM